MRRGNVNRPKEVGDRRGRRQDLAETDGLFHRSGLLG
jgi:hypothetical protein